MVTNLRWQPVFLIVLIALALTLCPSTGRAQGYLSPLIGYDFGGDASCPNITGCTDKRLNAGVSIGKMNRLLGFEQEFAYAKNFFGEAPNLSSSVLTVMSNVMVAPKIGPIRPYALVGLGLMKTHVDFTLASLLTTNNNSVAWDVGGGLIAMMSPHFGVRGDVRYFHSFQDLTVAGFTLSDRKLDFGRASAALVLSF